jgi:hypothetical protein
MITTFTAELPVANLKDATEQATEVWRDFIGDPAADLHWSTIMQVNRLATGDLTAHVTIKFTEKEQ